MKRLVFPLSFLAFFIGLSGVARPQGEVSAPATTAPGQTNRKLTVFHIKYADATTVSEILYELFRDFSIVVDARTNSLFVRCDEHEDIEELSEVLRLLDQPTKDAGQLSPTDPAAGKPKRQNVNQIPQIQNGGSTQVDVESIQNWLMFGVDEEYVEAVRATAAAAEAESIRTAKRMRDELKNGTDPEQNDEWRAMARRAVATAFAERQSLQISELALLRNRLTKIEAQIQAREWIKDRIIDHRLGELLDPALQWPALDAANRSRATTPKKGSPPLPLTGPAGLQQAVSPRAPAQGSGYPAANAEPGDSPARVQVRFTSPRGAKIAWSAHENLQSLVVPQRIDLKPGAQHGFILSEIAGRDDQQIAGSIQVYPIAKQSAAFLSHNAIPLEFTVEDFDQVGSGNLVTKVLFLPDPGFQELATVPVETLVSTGTDPEVDAVAEADRRGVILVLLRLGDRVHPAELLKFSTTNDEAELRLESQVRGGSGILFFESDACSVCAKVRPEFTQTMSKAGLPFLAIDVVKYPRIAKRFRVASTPTFVWVSSEVELERATGAEYQELVDEFGKYWEESDGSRSGIGFGGGLQGFLRQELVAALNERESLLTDITSLELTILELDEPVTIPEDASEEVRKSKQSDEARRKSRIEQTQELVESLRAELRPVDAKILLIRNRLTGIDSGKAGEAADRNTDPQDAVVWIEAIVEHASVNGKRDVSATYMNGTIISPQGHIAVCLGQGSTEEEARKALLKLTVQVSNLERHQGRLLAYDPQTGAAIIKIDVPRLPFLRVSDDPIAESRRLIVYALGLGDTPYPVRAPVWVVDSHFKKGDHEGFFAVAEASQTSLSEEYKGAPVVTTSGQLQGILTETEQILYGPAIQPDDPKPRRAAAIPASVITDLLTKTAARAVSPENSGATSESR